MKITTYQDIYERFLSKVEDEYLAYLVDQGEDRLNVALYPLLLSAINDFSRIAEHNLRKRDERNHVFYETLTEDEIEVLAILMKPVWLERYLNSSRKIEQQYFDAGIKTYSPNETMRNLLTLHDDYHKKLKNRLTEYGYKTVDISQFGGHE